MLDKPILEKVAPHQDTRTWPQIIASLSAALGSFAGGAVLGWTATVGPQLTAGDDQYFPIDDKLFTWVASITTIGSVISCWPIGIIMKKFGRKRAMLSLVMPYMVGWLMIIFS